MRPKFDQDNAVSCSGWDRKKWESLVGKTLIYLRDCDYDRSGRGYILPNQGKVVSIIRRQVEFENGTVEKMSYIREINIVD
jgi:hypothetical protein